MYHLTRAPGPPGAFCGPRAEFTEEAAPHPRLEVSLLSSRALSFCTILLRFRMQAHAVQVRRMCGIGELWRDGSGSKGYASATGPGVRRAAGCELHELPAGSLSVSSLALLVTGPLLPAIGFPQAFPGGMSKLPGA